jgi:LytS/YehU family sensor histidine kinase
MTTWLSNNKLVIAGILIGAIAGFFYWKLVGCNTGTCTITSKWHNSTVYGALMGGLLFSLFKREKKKTENE